MEQFLIFIIVKLLDPIGFVLVLLASIFLQNKKFTYIAAVIVAIALEFYVASVNHTVKFGMAIIPGIIASNLHAFLCNWATNKFRDSNKNPITKKAIEYMVKTIGISKESATSFAKHIDNESIDFLQQYTQNCEARVSALMPLFATVIASENYPNQDEPLVQGLKTDLTYIKEVQFPEALASGEISSELFSLMVSFSANTTAFLAEKSSAKNT